MKNLYFAAAALACVLMASPLHANAQTAMDELQQAADHGQQAIQAPSDDEAKFQSNQVFDTPSTSTGTATPQSSGSDDSNNGSGSGSDDDDDQ